MKSYPKTSLVAISVLALIGISSASVMSADPAFRAAKGKYKGDLTGEAVLPPPLGTQAIPPTPATVKLPAGKGKIRITIGTGTVKGKITKARVRQGGKKVSLKGKAEIPAAVTATVSPAFGAITGPFKAVVTIKRKPTVVASTTLAAAGATVKGEFRGSK